MQLNSITQLGILLMLPTSLQAATINVDFGTAAATYTGNGAVPSLQATAWQTIGLAANVTITDSTGANVGTISTARGLNSTTSIGFNNPGNANGQDNAGFFARTTTANPTPSVFDGNLWRDWVFSNISASLDIENIMAVRISGLAAGTYMFHLYAQEYNGSGVPVAGTTSITYGALAATSTSFTNLATLGTGSLVGTSTSGQVTSGDPLTGYQVGVNYLTNTVTINAGDNLYFFGDHSTLNQSASFNGLQLVSIPEPSSALLVGLGGLALLRRRR